MRRARRTSAVAMVAMLLVSLGTSDASAGPGSLRTTALAALHDEYAAHVARRSGLPFASRDQWARVVDDHVVIDAAADGDVGALVAELSSLGMRAIAVSGRVVSGQLPLAAIPALDAVPTLRFAQPSLAVRRAGPVTSLGDRAMRADRARAIFGVTGAGVQVGVLSDSFDCLSGAAMDVADGELTPVTVIQELAGCDDGTDEGRAMLQIVHDVAPGAALSFASAFNGLASFAANISALKNQGARVIVDDIIYFNEPMFQDGIVAQAVDAVVSQGVAYFSAAGNEGRLAYESVFRPGATFADGAIPAAPGAAFAGGVAHNFAPSGAPDHMQRITIGAGRTLSVSLQWDSPFFSVSGPPGSPNDVDLYLLNAAGTMVLRRAAVNNIGGDAVEVLTFTNNGATANFNLMILKFAGPNPGFLKYVLLGSSAIAIGEFDTASGSLFGHSNAAGAMTVGAALFSQTPEFGISPPRKESFSSAGPTPILFDTAGRRLPTPITRLKPEIVAPDGVATSVFGFDPFFGTSAAAPHAAGAAALILERKSALTPAALYAALESTAIDMGAPGFDFDNGYGLIQVDAAVQFVIPPSLAAAVLPVSRSVRVGTAATAAATILNVGTVLASGCTLAPLTSLPATFSFQTTDPATNQVTGSPNAPVDIAVGVAQSFVIAFTPTAPISPTEVLLSFDCMNTDPAPSISGLNTLLLSASTSPVPDVIALAATLMNDGIVNIPGASGTGVFSVATVNVGAGGTLTVSLDTGSTRLPVSLLLCQTNPATAACLGAPASTVTTTIDAGATPTFGVFVAGTGSVAFAPATNRIFVRLRDGAGIVRGATSVAVRTQ